jgi:opacity protein-like surface antigen
MRSGVVLAGLLLACPVAAAAQDAQFEQAGDSGLPRFAGLRGSFAFINNSSTTVPAAPPQGLHGAFDNGGGGSVYVGARLPAGFGIELEGLYRYLPIHSVTLGNANSANGVAGSHAQMGASMVNLFFDLPVPEFPLRPFFGAGVGGAYVAADAADNSGNDYLRSSNWQFAYQFMGGAEIPLSQSSRLTAMYRWLQVGDVNSKCGLGGAASFACKARYNTQSVDLGIEMDM